MNSKPFERSQGHVSLVFQLFCGGKVPPFLFFDSADCAEELVFFSFFLFFLATERPKTVIDKD